MGSEEVLFAGKEWKTISLIPFQRETSMETSQGSAAFQVLLLCFELLMGVMRGVL